MPTFTTHDLPCALNALTSCRDGLAEIILDANTAAMSLSGARGTRAKELVAQLDVAIGHCRRLATIVEGDLRSERALDAAVDRHPAGRAR